MLKVDIFYSIRGKQLGDKKKIQGPSLSFPLFHYALIFHYVYVVETCEAL